MNDASLTNACGATYVKYFDYGIFNFFFCYLSASEIVNSLAWFCVTNVPIGTSEIIKYLWYIHVCAFNNFVCTYINMDIFMYVHSKLLNIHA